MHPLFAGLEQLLEALSAHELRAVGGAVRAVLRHDPLAGVDIDLAINAPPEKVLSLCLSAKIPTTTPGLRWGTVTANINGQPVEITSLRKDNYLGGSRYPTVSFIESWEEDAARRDFTINAIYLSPQGEFFDPYGGEQDLKNGIVRFIGDPFQRLTEDPLRLLRFWRFCANYGMGGITPELIDVFHQSLPAFTSLSRHRVTQEWEKLQKAPQAATVISELARIGLLPAIESRLA